jgi:hypothetical protein
MAQDKITEIFDIQAIEANIAKAISAAKAALPELQKLGENIKANTTIGGASNNTAAANAAMAQFTQNLKEYTEAVKAAAAARINLSKVSDEEAAKQKVNSTALNAQLKEEVKLTSNLTSAYEKLNIQHKQAIKTYQQYALTLGETNKLTIQAKDNANRLGEQLSKIDAGVGNFRRNVGNYSSAWNGLGMSIQQVAREMPNFAQSMQLGFLAISNNLPILADEIKRTKENIKALKDEGKDAPSLFSQIASSVFSWQTLLTIGITLLVKYGAEIVDWASNVSEAEKMMRKYQEALTKTIEAEGEGISKLYIAKQAINDTTKSREEQNKALNVAIAEYPEYLQGLSLEGDSLEEINQLLDLQIEKRVENARQAAINNTIKDSTNELVKAQENLNKEYTNWEQFTSFFTTMGLTMNDLTDEAKNLVREYQNLNVLQGKDASLSNEQADKVMQLSKATKNLSASIKLQSDELIIQREILAKKIEQNQKEINSSVGLVKIGDSVRDHRKKEREQLELNNITLLARLNLLDDEIRKKKQLAGVDERLLKDGKDGLELLDLRAKALNAKDQSKEEIAAKEAVYRKEAEIEKKQLSAQYLNAAKNEEFKKREALIEAELQQKLEDLRKPKGAGRGAGRGTDTSSFDAKKRLIKAEADLDRERFEQSIATNKAIADNQNEYFTLRIQAEDDIATKQYEQAKRTFEEKISLLENEEKTIEKIRAKGAKTQAEKEKVSKNNTDAILAEKKLAEEEFVKTTLYIQGENQKQITKIYEQEVNKRLAIINGQLDAVQISGDNEKRVALEALKERFMAGEMKIKEYRAKAQTLEEEYDNKTLGSKKKVIEKELLNFAQSEEVRTELKGKYNNLNEIIEKNEFDSFVRTEDEKQKLREQIAQKQVELANEVANIIATINRAQNEQEIRDFEKKKELLQQDSELELYAIEQSSVAESEKANLKKVLAAETAVKEQEIANQIAEIKRKQAIADKAQALFSIALNTAIAVSQINASPAVNADPTQILRASLTKLVIGLGAVQAGIVLATPLPQYAKGKKASDGYEGLAIAGEKGTEMKIDKDGSLQLLTKPTLIHTKRGDTILSNRELMSGELGKHIKTGKEKANYDELIKAYSYHTDRTIKAIKNSPSNIIIDNSNYNLSLKRARV